MTAPAVVSHYNIAPTVDVFASVDGRDLGGVADDAAESPATVSKSNCRAAPRCIVRGPGGNHAARRTLGC